MNVVDLQNQAQEKEEYNLRSSYLFVCYRVTNTRDDFEIRGPWIRLFLRVTRVTFCTVGRRLELIVERCSSAIGNKKRKTVTFLRGGAKKSAPRLLLRIVMISGVANRRRRKPKIRRSQKDSSVDKQLLRSLESSADFKIEIFLTFCSVSLRCVLFHFVPFLFVPFHIVLFHSVPFHFVSFHFISFHFVPFHSVSFHFVPFHFVLFRSISFRSVLFFPPVTFVPCSILFSSPLPLCFD